MKKSVKRILCGTLSLMTVATLAVEGTLRLRADKAVQEVLSASASASFKDVTGEYDTSALREQYLNSSVLESEDTAPTYETRTVMVTLAGEPLVERAGDAEVRDYLSSWSGERARAEIQSEQTAFLRALDKTGVSYKLEGNYSTLLNAVAIEVNTKYVSTIKKMSGVDSAVITTSYSEPDTVQSYSSRASDVVENKTEVYETGIYDSSEYAAEYGQGMVVAILDTGLDYTHDAFQSFQTAGTTGKWSESDIQTMLDNESFVSESRSGGLLASDVYVNEKVPFAYDYADDDADVYPSYSNHGTHVAGIIGGYDENGYTDKDGNAITDKEFIGVVPDAQLVICKVFTDDLDDPDLGGAVPKDIIAALEDCVMLGVDVINMSLGTSGGFTTTNDGDSEGEMLNAVYQRIEESGITLVAAASNDYSSGYGGVYGTNLAKNPDSSTVGSPSTFSASFSVASINGQKASYMIANEGTSKQSYVFYEEARDIDGNPFDFATQLFDKYGTAGEESLELEYVVIPGTGAAGNYSSTIKNLLRGKNRIALIKRGDTTFEDKVKVAKEMGAIGVIVYNNVAGVIRMNLGEITDPVPAVSISMNAGNTLVQNVTNRVGKITINKSYAAGPFMSEFSSWGPTHDLQIKPEITAHGGEITSTVPGGYGEQSGTSMASPNMAGFMTLARSYVQRNMTDVIAEFKEYYRSLVNTEEEKAKITDSVVVNRLATQLAMSTAATVYDQDNLPYSPRKQGAGVGKLENVIEGTGAFLWTTTADGFRPKIELGDDPDSWKNPNASASYDLKFNITNFNAKDTSDPEAGKLTFSTAELGMTETLSSDGLTVNEQAHMFTDSAFVWKVGGEEVTEIVVPAGETVEITVTLGLGANDRAYIEESFENGMYIEGFLQLKSQNSGQCDLSIPFLGFYGDWDAAPMLDYSAFEVAEDAQDASVKDEDKKKASVWETQPYSSYYGNKYILPMGGYVYLLPDDADPVYVDEEHCAVSRYDDDNGTPDDTTDDYRTSTGIKAVYAGLLRNARYVRYNMYNVETGELIIKDKIINRVSKAYSGGGSAVPANVELELSPEEEALVANGKYRLEFEFFREELTEEKAPEENTFSFTFTVDYEAPILEDVRVRFYDYKDESGNAKRRIYLDVDVYDNHYAQALMVCYPKMSTVDGEEQLTLQLATEYPTPIRNAVRNGTTTVSIEITDIYEKYGNQLYLQIDDYALNSCLYQVNVEAAHGDGLPDDGQFRLADGESNLTLDIYEEHTVSFVFDESYTGDGNLANFLWYSMDLDVADVKDGKIVGIGEGTTKILVSNRKNATWTINVTVTGNQYASLSTYPSLSFGVIKTDSESLAKATGSVSVSAGKEFTLELETDPWYHPMTGLQVRWSSSDESVATVENGTVRTLKKGSTTIRATIYRRNSKGEWEATLVGTSVTLRVQNEFTVSNYTLTDYNGWGYNQELEINGETKKALVIPTDMNIMYIGEDAFKDNDNIEIVVIPSSVMEIRESAFEGCTALKEIYFVSTEAREDGNGNVINPDVDWADLSMVYEKAFYNCTSLEKVDLSNVKTITLANQCFAGCTSLSEVVDMPSIGTMHHEAFKNCALTKVDLTGLHMSGDSVFVGNPITEIVTGKFTAIGSNMFAGCDTLVGQTADDFTGIVLRTPKIGAGAFANCVNLKGVKFESPDGEALKFDIGARAFANCGSALASGEYFTVEFGAEIIRSLGDYAFVGSSLKELTAMNGLESLGSNVFANTGYTTLYLNDTIDLESLRLLGMPFDGIEVKLVDGYDGAKYSQSADGKVIYNKMGTKILYVDPSLTEYEFADTVTAIGDYAFANSSISSLVIPASVRSIGKYAFSSAKTTSVTFESGSELSTIPEGAFMGSKLGSVRLPESVTELGDYAFADSLLGLFEAENLQAIGNYAFAECFALYNIAFAETLETIGDYAFYNCNGLNTISIPALETMGTGVFLGASSLGSVTFGANVKDLGTYAFLGTPISSVTFDTGIALQTIGEGTFYGCTNLGAIKLPASVTEIGAYAFENCSSLSVAEGLENVRSFGAYAFFNSGLATDETATGSTKLALTNARTIGDYAFAAYDLNGSTDPETAYTALEIPNVVTIGNFAFLNGGISGVALPASVQSIGNGAFASAKNLTTVTVDAQNVSFFVENGVLYRAVDAEEGTYELVCYPAGLVGEGKKGSRSYSVKEGTVIVQAYAFYGLNEDALDSVTLPHSVNAIGDSAFFASGIGEYTFESIQAPVLEAVYRAEIEGTIETESKISYYKGYYYANFETYLFNFTRFVGDTSTLVMNYPSNGVGYDNHIYSLYFGVKNKSGVQQEDNTRTCISIIESMPSADVIKSWTDIGLVKETASLVKTAREYFNNASGKADQAQFLSAALQTKLNDTERALREVKATLGIPVQVASLRYDDTSYKSQYVVGDTFDMTGLKLIIVYDDYSEEIASASEITLLTTEALGKYDRTVTVRCRGIDLKLTVNVSEAENNGDDAPVDSGASDSASAGETKKSGCSCTISVVSAGFALLLVAGVLLVKKGKKRN